MDIKLELNGGARAASSARRFIAALSNRLPASVVDDVRLLVTELVTNSVRHAGMSADESVGLAIRSLDGAVRVEVSDSGPGFEPSSPSPARDRASGWGLFLVDRIADRWGVEREGGVRVWFEIDTSGRHARAEALSA